MTYRAEFSVNWRRLLGAIVGMCFGITFQQYIMALFAPALIAEFGWSKAQYALVGATPFITMFFIPFAGRIPDVLGVRFAAALGFATLPLVNIALSLMNGSFAVYFMLLVVKVIFGILTGSVIFSRVAVERFSVARGMALSIVATGAPLMGAIMTPFIAEIIAEHGWRDGFRALALISAVGGFAAVCLLGPPRERGKECNPAPAAPRRRLLPSRAELRTFLESPGFLLIIGGMFLVNIPNSLAGAQLKLVLLESEAPGRLATGLLSLYAIGVAMGRFLCGIALDKMAAHKVALVVLSAPALGLLALASTADSHWVLVASVLVIGLAQGAEGDVAGYLVARKFGVTNYSLIFSLVTIALTIGNASGAVIMSYMLHQTDRYAGFMVLSAVATVAGAFLFFLTGRSPSSPAAKVVDSARNASAATA